MREIRSSGSAEGVMSNHDPYSDFENAVKRHLLLETHDRPPHYAQPMAPRASPEFHIFVIWAILSPANCMT